MTFKGAKSSNKEDASLTLEAIQNKAEHISKQVVDLERENIKLNAKVTDLESHSRRGREKNSNLVKPICVLEAHNPEILSQWAKYKYVMVELYKLGLKPASLTRLCFTLSNGARKWISSVEEGHKYTGRIHRSPKLP